ncbi:hypothetical protein Peur_056023 [Populus x canadensis]
MPRHIGNPLHQPSAGDKLNDPKQDYIKRIKDHSNVMAIDRTKCSHNGNNSIAQATTGRMPADNSKAPPLRSNHPGRNSPLNHHEVTHLMKSAIRWIGDWLLGCRLLVDGPFWVCLAEFSCWVGQFCTLSLRGFSGRVMVVAADSNCFVWSTAIVCFVASGGKSGQLASCVQLVGPSVLGYFSGRPAGTFLFLLPEAANALGCLPSCLKLVVGAGVRSSPMAVAEYCMTRFLLVQIDGVPLMDVHPSQRWLLLYAVYFWLGLLCSLKLEAGTFAGFCWSVM